MQQNYIGLYYPYIHFRNESWLKLSALYWDKMARIVPDQDFPRDSDLVLALKNELDFIEDHSPRVEFDSLTNSFLSLIKRHERKLVKKYKVVQGQVDLTEMYFGKFSYELRQALLETNLAIRHQWNHEKLLMHPKLDRSI